MNVFIFLHLGNSLPISIWKDVSIGKIFLAKRNTHYILTAWFLACW